MLSRLSLVLLLCLAAPAAAHEHPVVYGVAGPDLAGRARVEPLAGEPGRVHVTLEARRFGKHAEALALSGEGTRLADGGVEWSYVVEERPGFARGLVRWLRDPFGGGAAWKPTQERVTVRMRADGAGVLRGEVGGAPQRWTPQDATLTELVVLAIPGLSTNNWNRVGIPYLDENLGALAARGIEGRRLEISTESSVATNAAFIAREIRREADRGKRVILLAHSKGATDATAALALEPALVAHVAGVIAIQPVYAGSPVADWVTGSAALSATVKVVFEKAFGGEGAAVTDLTHAARAAFVAAHPYPAGRVPTVVLRSTFDRKLGSRSVLWLNQKVLERRLGQATDGMVTLADQAIPGAVVTIDLEDLDHFEPGVRGESPHAPAEITNRALEALLPFLGPTRAATAHAIVDRALGE